MLAFSIKTNKSDYPFLVIANGIKRAVEVMYKQGFYDSDIISVRQLEDAKDGNILIEDRLTAREALMEEVRRVLQNDMPRWKPTPNGAMGGGDRDIYLIRTSKGCYFTSKSVCGLAGHYLELDTLEQLSGLPNEDGKIGELPPIYRVEEAISEDLQAAADNCYYRNHAYARESFIEGAQWKEQQIMKNAVNGVAHTDRDGWIRFVTDYLPECEYDVNQGDKVRLIIIKEDNK